MKNFWLNRANDICNVCGESFWPFNDENCLMQGDPMCACNRYSGNNLDILYGSMFIFIQNEVLQVSDKSKHGVTIYLCEYGRVMPGTMFGTIAFEGQDAFTFNVSESGKVVFTRTGKQLLSDGMTQEELDLRNLQEMAFSDLPIYTYYDTVYAGKLNAGEFTLEWGGYETPVVTVCYEYNRT